MFKKEKNRVIKMSEATLTDFPKLYCPFIRQNFKVDKDDFRNKGRKYQLRNPEAYLVVNQINPGYEWVFEDPNTFAVEKLNGSNVKIKTEQGRLIVLQNRKNFIDPLQIIHGKMFLLESVINAASMRYVKTDGEQAGESLGPKLQGNPYMLDNHLWYPFEKAIESLRYKSFDEHERNFDNWSSWFKDYLFSLFFRHIAKKKKIEEKRFAEGVVFYNLKRKDQNKTWMAKLRRDMFFWYYDGIKILDYNQSGRDEVKD